MIKLINSVFYNEDDTRLKLADFILRGEYLSMGKYCKSFEEAFAKKQGRKYAIFVNSGSSANLILIQALLNLGHLKREDKVGISALTWATNVMPLIQLGLTPVPIDCEIDTLNVSQRTLDMQFPSIGAMFITNALGFSDDLWGIQDYCQRYKILLLEDNCESLGSSVGGKLLGNFGLASTFSTYVGHHLSTVEGGLVCTDDDELHEELLMVREHGWDRGLKQKTQQTLRKQHHIDDFQARYAFYDLAYNVRPTELQGYLGVNQLQYWNKIVSARMFNFHCFQSMTKSNKDIIPLKVSHMDIVSNFAMPVVFKNKGLRDKYKKRFQKAEVEIRPIIAGAINKQPFYKKYISDNHSYANAELIGNQGFYFGNNPELMTDDIHNTIRGLLT